MDKWEDLTVGDRIRLRSRARSVRRSKWGVDELPVGSEGVLNSLEPRDGQSEAPLAHVTWDNNNERDQLDVRWLDRAGPVPFSLCAECSAEVYEQDYLCEACRG